MYSMSMWQTINKREDVHTRLHILYIAEQVLAGLRNMSNHSRFEIQNMPRRWPLVPMDYNVRSLQRCIARLLKLAFLYQLSQMSSYQGSLLIDVIVTR